MGFYMPPMFKNGKTKKKKKWENSNPALDVHIFAQFYKKQLITRIFKMYFPGGGGDWGRPNLRTLFIQVMVSLMSNGL